MAGTAVDRVGLDYSIEIRDLFSAPLKSFRDGLESVRQTFQTLKTDIAGGLGTAATIGKDFRELPKALDAIKISATNGKNGIDPAKLAVAAFGTEAAKAQKAAKPFADVLENLRGRFEAVQPAAKDSLDTLSAKRPVLSALSGELDGLVKANEKNISAEGKASAASLDAAGNLRLQLRSAQIFATQLTEQKSKAEAAATAQQALGASTIETAQKFDAAAVATTRLERASELVAVRSEVARLKLAALGQQAVTTGGQFQASAEAQAIFSERQAKAATERQVAQLRVNALQTERAALQARSAATQFADPNAFKVTQEQLRAVEAQLLGIDRRFPGMVKNVRALTDNLQSSSRTAEVLLAQFKNLFGILILFKAADAFRSLIQGGADAGVKFNVTLEEIRQNVSSTILGLADVRDATGKVVTGAQAIAISTAEADRQVKLLIADVGRTGQAAETVATTFRDSLGAGIAAGFNLDQIRELTILLENAAQATGKSQEDISNTFLALGSSAARATPLMKSLGISLDELKRARETGTSFEFLTGRLAAFATQGDDATKSLQDLSAQLKGQISQAAGIAATGLFDQIKKSVLETKKAISEGGGLAPDSVPIRAASLVFDKIGTVVKFIADTLNTLTFKVAISGASGLGQIIGTIGAAIVTLVSGASAAFAVLLNTVGLILQPLDLILTLNQKIANATGGWVDLLGTMVAIVVTMKGLAIVTTLFQSIIFGIPTIVGRISGGFAMLLRLIMAAIPVTFTLAAGMNALAPALTVIGLIVGAGIAAWNLFGSRGKKAATDTDDALQGAAASTAALLRGTVSLKPAIEANAEAAKKFADQTKAAKEALAVADATRGLEGFSAALETIRAKSKAGTAESLQATQEQLSVARKALASFKAEAELAQKSGLGVSGLAAPPIEQDAVRRAFLKQLELSREMNASVELQGKLQAKIGADESERNKLKEENRLTAERDARLTDEIQGLKDRVEIQKAGFAAAKAESDDLARSFGNQSREAAAGVALANKMAEAQSGIAEKTGEIATLEAAITENRRKAAGVLSDEEAALVANERNRLEALGRISDAERQGADAQAAMLPIGGKLLEMARLQSQELAVRANSDKKIFDIEQDIARLSGIESGPDPAKAAIATAARVAAEKQLNAVLSKRLFELAEIAVALDKLRRAEEDVPKLGIEVAIREASTAIDDSFKDVKESTHELTRGLQDDLASIEGQLKVSIDFSGVTGPAEQVVQTIVRARDELILLRRSSQQRTAEAGTDLTLIADRLDLERRKFEDTVSRLFLTAKEQPAGGSAAFSKQELASLKLAAQYRGERLEFERQINLVQARGIPKTKEEAQQLDELRTKSQDRLDLEDSIVTAVKRQVDESSLDADSKKQLLASLESILKLMLDQEAAGKRLTQISKDGTDAEEVFARITKARIAQVVQESRIREADQIADLRASAEIAALQAQAAGAVGDERRELERKIEIRQREQKFVEDTRDVQRQIEGIERHIAAAVSLQSPADLLNLENLITEKKLLREKLGIIHQIAADQLRAAEEQQRFDQAAADHPLTGGLARAGHNIEVQIGSIGDMVTRAGESVAQGLSDGIGQAIVNVLDPSNYQSVGEKLRTFFSRMVADIIATFAKLALAKIFILALAEGGVVSPSPIPGGTGKKSGGPISRGEGTASAAHAFAPGYLFGSTIKSLKGLFKPPNARDTVPIWAEPQEFMMRKDAHLYYGTDVFNRINSRLVPRELLRAITGIGDQFRESTTTVTTQPGAAFKMGGPVGSSTATGSGSQANPSLTIINVFTEEALAQNLSSDRMQKFIVNRVHAGETVRRIR